MRDGAEVEETKTRAGVAVRGPGADPAAAAAGSEGRRARADWGTTVAERGSCAGSLRRVAPRVRGERGQATIELVAAVPALLLAALISLQLLAAGYAMTLADGAAEAGALALAEGGSAAEAAREALPGWADDDVSVSVDGRRGLGPPAAAVPVRLDRRPPRGDQHREREVGRDERPGPRSRGPRTRRRTGVRVRGRAPRSADRSPRRRPTSGRSCSGRAGRRGTASTELPRRRLQGAAPRERRRGRRGRRGGGLARCRGGARLRRLRGRDGGAAGRRRRPGRRGRR